MASQPQPDKKSGKKGRRITVAGARRGMLTSEPLLLLGAVILALYFGREILIPLALALTLNFLLTPAVLGLEKLKVARVPAVMLVMILLGLIVGGVGYVVATQLLRVADDIPKYRQNIHARALQFHAPRTGHVGDALNNFQDIQKEVTGTEPNPKLTPAEEAKERRATKAGVLPATPVTPTPVVVITPPLSDKDYLRNILRPMLKPLGTAGMVFIFTMYMLVKREDLRNRLLLLAGMGQLNIMTQALNDAGERISRYLLMNAAVNAGFGAVFGVALYLVGVPYATLWGVLIGILRVVPYVGTLIGGVIPLLFTLAVFTTWWQPVTVLLLFLGLEAIVGNVIEPMLYGAHTGISSLALLATAIVWTLLWGWPGLVLSTPLTVVLIVMGRYVPQMGFLHILLGDEAELTPEAQFYERLLAMDQSEAHSIADKYLEGRPLVDLYDQVLLPALSLAEQDRHKGALDSVRASFLFQSATELIAELAEYRLKLAELEAAPDAELSDARPTYPDKSQTRSTAVVCIPVHDQADEIVATMLSQLLEQMGHKTMLLPPVALTDEILSKLAEEPETTICISALPPFAFVHARTLCHRIREFLPNNCIMVGLWGAAGDSEVLRERLGRGMADSVVTSLKAAIETEMTHSPIERRPANGLDQQLRVEPVQPGSCLSLV